MHWRVFNPARGWRVLLPQALAAPAPQALRASTAQVAFCGGINLIDDYLDPTYGTLEQPRFDFAVRVTGPLVADVARDDDAPLAAHAGRRARRATSTSRRRCETVRARRRRRHRRRRPAHGRRRISTTTRTQPHAGLLAGLVLRDNVRFRKRIEHFYRYAIDQAQREILIANAYFVPGVALQRALLRAAQRGVKVTLLLQGRYEYFMQHHTSRAMYGVLLDAGIEIIEYEPSFLHAKVAVFDSPQGAIATVGSSNLDPISLLLAREANVFVRDDAFAAELRGHLRRRGARASASGSRRRRYLQPAVRHVRSLAWLAYAPMRLALFATRHRY